MDTRLTMHSVRLGGPKGMPLRASVYYPADSKSTASINEAMARLNKELGRNISYSVLLATLARFFNDHHAQFDAERHVQF